MQVVIRKYSGKGAKELWDAIEKNPADLAEIETIMRSVKGFVSYTVASTDGGGISVTTCQDQAGIDESVKKAKDFIAKHAANTGLTAPEVSTGKVILHLK